MRVRLLSCLCFFLVARSSPDDDDACPASPSASYGEVWQAASTALLAGRRPEAVSCLSRCVSLDPANAQAWLTRAHLHLDMALPQAALDGLAAAPEGTFARPEDGAVALKLQARATAAVHGQQAAAPLLRELVRLDATDYESLGLLGQAHTEAGEVIWAISHYERALEHLPVPPLPLSDPMQDALVPYFNNLLQLYLADPTDGHLVSARDLCERSLPIFPKFRSHFVAALAQVLSTAGPQRDLERAQQLLADEGAADNAGQPAGSHAERVFSLGKAALAASDYEQALEHFTEAVRLLPDSAGAHYARGIVIKQLRLSAQAATDEIGTASRLAPDNDDFYLMWLHSLKAIADWTGLEAALQAGHRDGGGGGGGLHAVQQRMHPFSCLMFNCSAELVLARSRAFASERAAEARRLAGPGWDDDMRALRRRQRRRREDRPLTVGYVSSNFVNHAQGTQLQHFFVHNDPARTRVMLYSLRAPWNEESRAAEQQLRATVPAGSFVDVSSMSDAQAARRVAEDGVHVLIDLCGLADEARLGIFALRPAPVIVSFLGYPSTTGAEYIDYYVGDAVSTPAGSAAAVFTERLILMPATYQVTEHATRYPHITGIDADGADGLADDPLHVEPAALDFARKPTARDLGLTSAHLPVPAGRPRPSFVFCNFNQAIKIGPAVFAVWMRLLDAVPGSVLWLLALPPDAATHLRAQAVRHGVDPDRLVMVPSVPKHLHMRRMLLADLLLDTPVYNAHTSAGDALWAALPLVTVAESDLMAARVAASMLAAAGLSDARLVAPNLDAYYDRALELATDPGQLARLRARIWRARRAMPLFDTAAYYRNWTLALEHVYRVRNDKEEEKARVVNVDELAASESGWEVCE